jgi:HSP20 family protein
MTNIVKRENGRQPATFGNVVDQVFQNTVSRLLDDNFWEFGGAPVSSRVPVNMRETDNSYEMELAAPGLRKEDFNLGISGNVLTVSFEDKKEDRQEDANEGWIRREFRRQSFSRSFTLDDTVDVDKISARYENGVLQLSLPKNEKARKVSRTIQIQ